MRRLRSAPPASRRASALVSDSVSPMVSAFSLRGFLGKDARSNAPTRPSRAGGRPMMSEFPAAAFRSAFR